MKIFIMMMFFGLFSLSLIRSHMLLCLISLEFIVLYLLMIIYLYCLMFFMSMYIYVVFLIFLVCEGVLGLGLMVLMIRCHSNDYLSSMFLW